MGLKKLAAVLLLATAFTAPAHAQFSFTSPQTIGIQVFNNAACAATAPPYIPIKDIGQDVHVFLYGVTGSVTALDIAIEGSPDGVNWRSLLFNDLTAIGPGLSQGTWINIWIQKIRVRIVSCTGSGTVNMWYSGTNSLSPTPNVPFPTPAGPFYCSGPPAVINGSGSGEVLLVSGTSGKSTHVCEFSAALSGSSNVEFDYGTTSSTPCDTGTTALTGNYQSLLSLVIDQNLGLAVPAGKDLCLNLGSSVTVGGAINAVKF